MIKSTALLFRLLLQSYWRIFVPWLAIQVLLWFVFLLFRPLWMNIAGGDFGGAIWFVGIVIAYAMSLLALAGYLGYLFHPSSGKSWRRQLPISGWAFSLVPQMILFGYSAAIYFAFYPVWVHGMTHWGVAVSLFLFFMPLLTFYSARRFRNWALGIAVSVVINLVVFFLWAGFFWSWIGDQWQIQVEAIFIVLTAITALFLERERKAFVVPLIVLMSVAGGASVVYRMVRFPSDFGSAVFDLKYAPTQTAIDRYRQYATDRTLWKHTGWDSRRFFPLDAYSRDFAHIYLNEDQRLEFLKVIFEFQDNFQNKPEYGFLSDYPLHAEDATAKLQDYLLAKGDKKSDVFCKMVAMVPSRRFFEVFFTSSCKDRIQMTDLWFKYAPNRGNPFDRLLEEFFLSAHKAASPEIKEGLSTAIPAMAGWKREDLPLVGSNWLEMRPMTPDLLAKWKKDFLKAERTKIQEFSRLPRERFVEAISNVETPIRRDGWKAYRFFSYFCNRVSDRCSVRLPLDHRRSIAYHLQKQFGHTVYKNEEIMALRDELLNEENWAKIQALAGQE